MLSRMLLAALSTEDNIAMPLSVLILMVAFEISWLKGILMCDHL
jgi:hypothetical protein